jgi:putative tricarboxylic transport membrane protein
MRLLVWAVSAAMVTMLPMDRALAQAWKPTRTIEIIVGSAAGGGADATGRTMQRLLQEKLLPDVASSVVNKTGGGSALSYVYLNQHPGDAHFVALSLQPMITGPIVGAGSVRYTDMTPLAHLFNEYVGFAVRPDSSIKSAREAIERLRADPGAYSIGLSTALGGSNHLATVFALKSAGVDVRKLRIVVVKGASEAMTGVMGGHIDIAAGSAASMISFLGAGKLRGLAVSSPQRLAGVYADVPTWSEVVGKPAAYSNWRGVIGPRGLTPAQIRFWDEVLGKMTQTDEWKADLAQRFQEPDYKASAETRRFLDEEHAQFRAILAELGLAK